MLKNSGVQYFVEIFKFFTQIWAFPEIFRIPLLRVTKIPGGFKNENLENSRGGHT